MKARAAAAVLGVLLTAGCDAFGGPTAGPTEDTSTDPPSSVGPAEITVFAAASLTDVVAEAARGFEFADPDTIVTVATDSSAALATQIEQGAPADVFLSADPLLIERLIGEGLAVGDPIDFASNELVVIVPAGNPAGIDTFADLANADVRIIAAGEEVPITTYVDRLLARVADDPSLPSSFGSRYAAAIVSRESNVRAVVAKIELGEADAAIVYATDAQASDAVETVAIPRRLNVQATYAGIVVAGSREPGAAAGFLEWFLGPSGQAILAAFGFLPPPE